MAANGENVRMIEEQGRNAESVSSIRTDMKLGAFCEKTLSTASIAPKKTVRRVHGPRRTRI
jgi:hypothetical protein